MKTIVVTGGAGFIGSNIVAELTGAGGYDVVVCDWLGEAAEGKWRNIAKHPIADFVAPDKLFGWLDGRKGDVEAIVHMGAVSSTTEPDADHIVHSNFTLSRDLWTWAVEHGARLVYASSAATYGGGEQGFEGKDDLQSLSRLRPLNAYGWSKFLFDLYARREVDRGRAPRQWVGLKFFNVYGPNEGHKGSMKSVIAQIWPKVSAGKGVQLFRSHRPDYEDGGQLRDFVYVRDCAQVAAWLLETPEVNGIFNLGTGKARSFADLARAVFAAAGREPEISYVDTPVEIRDKYQYFTEADMSRLKAAGYAHGFTELEAGAADYVGRYLSQEDPYR
jgi:ADP-L-glycero-D-manno-heptose 6-epimerase